MTRQAIARTGNSASRTSAALGFAAALAAALLASAALAPSAARAQAKRAAPDIEELFKDEESKEDAGPAEMKPPETPREDRAQGGAASANVKRLSDLSNLQPFSDIAVLQKRFLPKTKRFEFFGGGQTVLNDAFFINFGLAARLGYYFRERWGVELVTALLATGQRDVTKGLENRRITTTSLVTPVHYFGLDVKWSPIYGKMTYANQKIVPFDLYFSFGGGATGTNQGQEAMTGHLGTGQIFALSKSLALRWDLSWYMYSSSSGADPSRGSSLYNNVFMTVGASFFFPEATYR